MSLQYPDIELHALRRLDPAPDAPNSQEQRQGVYLHIANHAQGGAEAEDDEDEEGEDSKITEITIIPARIEPHEGRDSDPPVKPPAEALFQALSTCANLHPDPTSSDDDEDDEVDRYIHEGDVEGDVGGMIIPGTGDGSLPEPFPGSGGWITAENVGRYFDADGQWLGRGAESVEAPLGPGSGRVRTRDEADAGDVADAETDGYENGTDESKWQRTG